MSLEALTVLARAMIALLPVYGHDRGSPTKAEQLERVAQVTAAAVEQAKGWQGDKRQLLAFQLAFGDAETHFSERIGRGECESYECDAYYERGGRRVSYASWQKLGGTVFHRSAGWWQLQERIAGGPAALLRVASDEAFSARVAARAIVSQRGVCRSLERGGDDWVRMTFASLAARGCAGSFRGIDGRVQTYLRLVRAG